MYQRHDIADGGGGAAALRTTPFVRLDSGTGFGARAARAPAAAPPRWRGILLCTMLSGTALALAPGLEPIAGAAPPRLDRAAQRQLSALAVESLGAQGETGRRMAPTEAVKPLDHVPERPRIALVARFGAGDSLERVLQRAGVAGSEAAQVATMIAPIVAPDRIAGGTAIDLTLGRRFSPYQPRPIERLAFRARLDMQVAVRRAGGALQLQALPIAIDETPLRIQGVVSDGLYLAARAAGAPAAVVQSYLRALATRIDVGAVGRGDRFDLIVAHRRAATGEAETGRLLYAGLAPASGEALHLLEWPQNGRSQWIDAAGAGQSSGGTLQRPVPGTVSSAFGWRRHPILGYTRLHRGMDFRAGYGTPILAATDGTVARAGWAGGYGKQVRLAHGGGYATSYSHMSRILAQPGEFVRQGQVIGYVGSTGLSTGPHLHYELIKDGVAIDPAAGSFMTRAGLAGPELEAMRARLAQLLATPVG